LVGRESNFERHHSRSESVESTRANSVQWRVLESVHPSELAVALADLNAEAWKIYDVFYSDSQNKFLVVANRKDYARKSR
jgi:hypothetical protein